MRGAGCVDNSVVEAFKVLNLLQKIKKIKKIPSSKVQILTQKTRRFAALQEELVARLY